MIPNSPFTVFPAIDLKEGACVRLVRGEMASATVFNTDPAAQARSFQDQGFRELHMVDLDGAFAGESRNREAVKAVLKIVTIPVQLGGGIRTEAQIEAWLAEGLSRVILGTVAARDPALVRAAARRWPGRIAVGIDAKDGLVAVSGWAEATHLAAPDLAARFADAGVVSIIFTDVGRDGTGQGINVPATQALALAAGPVPVIASGGLGGIGDVGACRQAGFAGVIAGRALYDGRLDAGALKAHGYL